MHDIFTVMEKDSIETSHAVSTYVEDPRDVQQYFDEISYEKVGLIFFVDEEGCKKINPCKKII